MATTTINVPRCIECERNLLTEWAWLSTPAGFLCFSCEASKARQAAIEKLTARRETSDYLEELRAKARRKVELERGRNLPAHARRDVRRRANLELGQ